MTALLLRVKCINLETPCVVHQMDREPCRSVEFNMNAHQFQGDGFELPLAKLLESGLPAIVLIAEKGYHHFVVIKGMRDGRILIGDPSTGTRAISRTTFDSIWVNKVLFVIHNKQKEARFNVETDWQVAPRAPLVAGVSLDSLSSTTLTKFGPGDF